MDTRSFQLVHDLKMPIQLIYSCVQLLEMELSPNARAESYLQMLLRSADQLQSMVSTALDENSPADEGLPALQAMDVVALARSISRQCALLADEKGVRMHFETNAATFRMATSAEKLRRILQNLLSNALRFTPSGGHICLSVLVRGDSIEFSVGDSGCGIAPEMQADIFRPGVSSGSTGLGLAIVREYARELGGDVRLDSRVGRGSRFTVRLPVVKAGTLMA